MVDQNKQTLLYKWRWHHHLDNMTKTCDFISFYKNFYNQTWQDDKRACFDPSWGGWLCHTTRPHGHCLWFHFLQFQKLYNNQTSHVGNPSCTDVLCGKVYVTTAKHMTNVSGQFVILKPLSYSFEEMIGFDVKASFPSHPVSRLIKAGDVTKELVPQDFSWIENYKLWFCFQFCEPTNNQTWQGDWAACTILNLQVSWG